VMIGDIFDIAGAAAILAGVAFMLIGVVGIWRFPDFYARLHAAGVSDALGVSLVIFGAIMMAGLSMASVKLAVLGIFLAIAGPTATHALAGAAYRRDVAEEKNGGNLS